MSERRRGQIEPRGEGSYRVRVFVGRDGTGKRQYVSETVNGTISQAKQALTRLLNESDKGLVAPPSRLTVSGLFTDYLSAKKDIATTTREQYQQHFSTYLEAPLGTLRVTKLVRRQIQDVIDALTAKGLSPRTIEYVYAILRSTLNQAIEWGFLVRNPCEFVKLPKKAGHETRKEMQTLTPEQTVKLLDTASSDLDRISDYALWCVLLIGGLRPQEACGLKWSDLSEEPEGIVVSLQRAVKWPKTGPAFLGDLKTPKSRRMVPLDERATLALKRHRTEQAKEILRVGEAYTRNGLVFAGEKGTILDLSAVRRRWKAATKTAGVTGVRLYDSRHTNATLLLASGENLKVVSERLGHSTVALTGDTYSHVNPSMQRAATTRLSRLLSASG